MKLSAEFIKSAVDPAQFPAPSVPEVAFLGRSNVGKSSLLNSLVGHRLAYVSSTPGRTQMINFFALRLGKPRPQPDLILADLPGYGYAKAPKDLVRGWASFVDPYLLDRPTLRLCMVLVDSNIPPQQSDLQLADWLRRRGREFQIIATKADRLSGNSLRQSLLRLEKALGTTALPYSAKTGRGRNELLKIMRSIPGPAAE